MSRTVTCHHMQAVMRSQRLSSSLGDSFNSASSFHSAAHKDLTTMSKRDIPRRISNRVRGLFHRDRKMDGTSSTPSESVQRLAIEPVSSTENDQVVHTVGSSAQEGPITQDSHSSTRNTETLSTSGAIRSSEQIQVTTAVDGAFPTSPGARKMSQKEMEEAEYWGPIKNISDEKLIALVQNTVKPKVGGWIPDWQVIRAPRGAFNQSYILESDSMERVNVRVPACGFHPRWNEIDAQLLRDTALGMEWVRRETDLPIPELLAYDDTFDNEIGAPYILMTFIDGRPLGEAWIPNGDDVETVHRRRLRILKGLADLVVRFNSLKFDCFGALSFKAGDIENPSISGAMRLDDENIFTLNRKFFALSVDCTLKSLIATRKDIAVSVCLKEIRQIEGYGSSTKAERAISTGSISTPAAIAGYYSLWQLIQHAFLAVTGVQTGQEEFVLMQSDFSPQNILVNDESDIVGLIDWDCLEAIPRQAGWATFPHWLAADWNVEWVWPAESGVLEGMKPDDFDTYRGEYCRFLEEVCSARDDLSDCQFTSKSHIYRSLLSSYESFDKIKGFVINVLADIVPRNTKSINHYAERIGDSGFLDGEEEWLKSRLEEYLLPDPLKR